MPRSASVRRAVPAVLAAVSLAGCGGGDDPSGPDGSTSTVAQDRTAALIAAVCGSVTRAVPPVPGPEASPAAGRAYVRAVVTATDALVTDLDRLAARTPDRREDLRELAARARDVLAVARRTDDVRAAAEANDLAGSIAQLNLAATRDRLPQCGL